MTFARNKLSPQERALLEWGDKNPKAAKILIAGDAFVIARGRVFRCSVG